MVLCVIWHKIQGTISLSHKASNILTETDDDIQRNHTRPKNSKWNVSITIQVSRSRNYMHKLLSPQIFAYKHSFIFSLKTYWKYRQLAFYSQLAFSYFTKALVFCLSSSLVVFRVLFRYMLVFGIIWISHNTCNPLLLLIKITLKKLLSRITVVNRTYLIGHKTCFGVS